MSFFLSYGDLLDFVSFYFIFWAAFLFSSLIFLCQSKSLKGNLGGTVAVAEQGRSDWGCVAWDSSSLC